MVFLQKDENIPTYHCPAKQGIKWVQKSHYHPVWMKPPSCLQNNTAHLFAQAIETLGNIFLFMILSWVPFMPMIQHSGLISSIHLQMWVTLYYVHSWLTSWSQDSLHRKPFLETSWLQINLSTSFKIQPTCKLKLHWSHTTLDAVSKVWKCITSVLPKFRKIQPFLTEQRKFWTKMGWQK